MNCQSVFGPIASGAAFDRWMLAKCRRQSRTEQRERSRRNGGNEIYSVLSLFKRSLYILSYGVPKSYTLGSNWLGPGSLTWIVGRSGIEREDEITQHTDGRLERVRGRKIGRNDQSGHSKGRRTQSGFLRTRRSVRSRYLVTRSKRSDLETFLLEDIVSFHAPVLVGRANDSEF